MYINKKKLGAQTKEIYVSARVKRRKTVELIKFSYL